MRDILIEQNSENSVPDIQKVREFHNNLLNLGTLADTQMDTRYILAQMREPLSIQHLRQEQERTQEAAEYIQKVFETQRPQPTVPKKPAKSREECKWKPDEHKRFLHALQLYGEKSLDQITDHIGTRTKVQVRSHLQKHKLKLKNAAARQAQSGTSDVTTPLPKADVVVKQESHS